MLIGVFIVSVIVVTASTAAVTDAHDTGIPRQIWQTYRTATLPQVAKIYSQTWRTSNPSWMLQFSDDDDARRQIAAHFDAEHVAVFDSYPIGVMRADFWRYCILYAMGGVYADIDTLSEQPIESWLMGGTRGLILGVENDEHLIQWAMAAKKNHPALAAVIAEAIRRSREPQCRHGSMESHSVHYCTGPALFTHALLRFTNQTSIRELQQTAPKLDIFVHPQLMLNGQAVRHAFASVTWKYPSYTSWRRQLDEMVFQRCEHEL
jgi:mannosyltransferase OCH1-like enzyme